MNTETMLQAYQIKVLCMDFGQWVSPGTLVSSINKTDRHYITELVLKVALNNIILFLNCLPTSFASLATAQELATYTGFVDFIPVLVWRSSVKQEAHHFCYFFNKSIIFVIKV